MGKMEKIRDLQGEEMVVIPRAEYDRLRRLAVEAEAREDAVDTAAAKKELARIKAGTSALIPHEVVKAIIIGRLHPIRALREHAGLTAQALAKKTKLARTTITQIETRQRSGNMLAYAAIAKALGTSVDVLIEK